VRRRGQAREATDALADGAGAAAATNSRRESREGEIEEERRGRNGADGRDGEKRLLQWEAATKGGELGKKVTVSRVVERETTEKSSVVVSC
jgi:hypothetical protein